MRRRTKRIKKRFRVRFHLGKGANYMHWQVTDRGIMSDSGDAREYYSPDKVEIVMHGAKLGNQVSTALKIFEGENKTVCAWVECDAVDINYKASKVFQETDVTNLERIMYNPRKNPHWFTDDDHNIDDKEFRKLTTKQNKIYG